MADVTVQTPKGPMHIPDWADALEKGEVLPNTPGISNVARDVKPAKQKTYVFEIDGHKFESDHMLSTAEAKQIQSKLAPPLSQTKEGHPYLATAARVGAPIVGGILGAASPIPGGAAIGGSLGAAGGEAIAEKLEGRDISPLEVGTQAALGAVAPGAGKTVLGGAAKAATYGLGSVTLSSLSKGEGLPSVGEAALGTVFGGLLGGGITKLHLRSALREVLPTEVADEAHSIITEGKVTAPVATEVDKESVSEVTRVTKALQRDARGRFVKEQTAPKPKIRLHVGDEPHEVIAPEQQGQKFRWKRVGKGEYVKEPISGEPEVPPVEEGPSPKKYQDPKGLTATLYKATPPPRLFDRLQKQTGVPVYDDVYKPIHDNIHDFEALEKEVKRIKGTYLDKSNIPQPVKDIIGNYTQNALHVNDKTYQNLVFAIKQFRRNLPLFGKEISDQEAHDLANLTIGAPQLSLLGARVGTPLRVLSHIFQTGYMQLGERGLAKGVKSSLTRQGWLEASIDGVLEKTAAPEEIAETSGKLGKMMRASYYGIGKAADLSRVITYQGQKYLTARAIQKAGGNVESFVKYAKLRVGLLEAEMGNIVKLYQQRKMREVVTASGVARANSSVPLHSRAERAMGTTGGVGGRMAGGLSTWPLFYGNLLKETFLTGAGTKTEKALAFARWYGANYILSNMIAKPIYENIVGEDPEKAKQRAEGFTYFSPLFYTLGPAVDIYKGTVEGTKELVTGRNKYGNEVSGGKALLHTAKALKPAIPYSYAISDVASGIGTMLRKTTEDR